MYSEQPVEDTLVRGKMHAMARDQMVLIRNDGVQARVHVAALPLLIGLLFALGRRTLYGDCGDI